MTPIELEKRLHVEIPLSQAMGVRVLALDESAALLEAPLLPNINHKRTAFGGSVHSLAVLACWSLVTSRLSSAAVSYIVIQDSRIDYLRPVAKDFQARAVWESTDGLERFLKTLERKKVGRIELKAEVLCEGDVCAVLTGHFVASVDT